MTINRPREELFAFWRNFENLERVMEHVESVRCQDERRSHWRVRRGPDKFVEWDAEIINERPNELIAWRTLAGSEVNHPAQAQRGGLGHHHQEDRSGRG